MVLKIEYLVRDDTSFQLPFSTRIHTAFPSRDCRLSAFCLPAWWCHSPKWSLPSLFLLAQEHQNTIFTPISAGPHKTLQKPSKHYKYPFHFITFSQEIKKKKTRNTHAKFLSHFPPLIFFLTNKFDIQKNKEKNHSTHTIKTQKKKR